MMKVQNRHEFGGVIATEKATYEHSPEIKEERKESALAAILECNEKSMDFTEKAIVEELSHLEKSDIEGL